MAIGECERLWRSQMGAASEYWPGELGGLQWFVEHPGPEGAMCPLGTVLQSLMSVAYLIEFGEPRGWTSDEDKARVRRMTEEAHGYVVKHLAGVSRVFAAESTRIIRQHHRFVAIVLPNTSHSVLREELLYSAMIRDVIEGYCHADELFHPTLVLPVETRSVIQDADNRLRQIGPDLWQSTGVIRLSGEDRCKKSVLTPETHWWWWQGVEF